MAVFYRRNTPGQMKGIYTRPTAGMNEYHPSVSIGDNHFSDLLDVESYLDESVLLNSNATLPHGLFNGGTDTDGIILEATAIQGGMVANVSDNGYALLVCNKTGNAWFIRHVKDKTTAITSYALTGLGLPDLGVYPNITLLNYGSCNFSTEALNYVCFTCEYTKKLIFFNSVDLVVGSISLPFYPKKIVSHASRVFAIDTTNKLWWCRAGDIYSWYGMEYDDDVLMAASNMKATAYTITGVIDVSRPITATVAQVTTLDTLGNLEIVGTNTLDQVQTESRPLAVGRTQSLKSYKTITSLTTPSWVISGGNDTISFGTAPISGGFVQEDAGYWAIEREKSLTDICVMSNNLYIFAPDNIYIFKGYSYDTFLLNQCVVNFGIKQNATPRKWLTTINNMSYFYDNGDIYEFNGYDYPRLISHAEYLNGSLKNGILGGIALLPTTVSLASDNDHLYVYDSTSLLHNINPYRVFNTKTRTWWKKSGFTKNNSVYTTTAFRVFYVTMISTDDIVSFISVDTTAGIFDMHYEQGHKGLYSPYLITKAFNTNPSELGTLTSIILEIKGTAAAKSDIILYYSVTSNADDFIEFKRYTQHEFNGDIEILDIPVPISYIANKHHYRIKIECSASTEIFNIERRFRVRGRTR